MRTLNRRAAFALSLLFGLAVVAIFVSVSRPRQDAAGIRPQPAISIVVATQDISPRTLIRPEMVARQTVEPASAPKEAAKDFTSVFGMVALHQLQKGRPILVSDVAAPGPQLGLSYDLKQNQRAITVPIDPVSGVAGFLKPGDHVDVIATYSSQDTNVTRTVLQNVELLAIGSQPNTTSRADASPNRADSDAPTATLAVSVDQVDTLALIAAKSKIHLALRSPDDKAVTPPAPVTTRAVFGVNEGAAPVAQAPAAPAPAPIMVPSPAPVAAPRPAPAPASRPAPRAKEEPAGVVVTRGTETQTVPVH